MPFTKEHESLAQAVRRFVHAEINPHVDEWERAGAFPAHELFRKLGQQGFLGITTLRWDAWKKGNGPLLANIMMD